MRHGQTVASATSASSATIPARGRAWQEPTRTRRSKAQPAADHPIAIAVAPAGDRARDLRDLTSFANRVLGWATPAAVANPSAGAA